MFQTHSAGRRAYWKRAAVLLLAALLCFGLSGCRILHHLRWEVLSYLKENYPGEKVKVSWRHGSQVDGVHELSNIWTWNCCFADMPEVVFQVEDSWVSHDYSADGYTLGDNAASVFWDYYLDLYRSEVGSLDAWTPSGYSYTWDSYTLTLYYNSMEQVYLAAEQLQDFHDWLSVQPHAQSTFGTVQIDYQIDSPLPLWHQISKTRFTYNEADSMAEECGDTLKSFCAFYGLPFDGCTEEELRDYAVETWPWDYDSFSVWHGGEQIPLETFAGIALSYRHFSYAGLYELLSRLGIEVDGTPEHFSFPGADGCLYEFSYDFCDQGWYYLRDGEIVAGTGNTKYAPIVSMDDSALFQNIADIQFVF